MVHVQVFAGEVLVEVRMMRLGLVARGGDDHTVPDRLIAIGQADPPLPVAASSIRVTSELNCTRSVTPPKWSA